MDAMDPQRSTPAPNCDILNNSPALHSLKRQQLVQLCKRNGIKATGKNSDIIEKLKAHALKSPLSPNQTQNHNHSSYPVSLSFNNASIMSSDDEGGGKENWRLVTKGAGVPRPSEAWTVIEEDSREVELMQMGLMDIRHEIEEEMKVNKTALGGFAEGLNANVNVELNESLSMMASTSTGEFGGSKGTPSSKASTMALSLKAFANSFKKGGSTNSKFSTSTSMMNIPPSIEPATGSMTIFPVVSTLSTPPPPVPAPTTSRTSPRLSSGIFNPDESVDRSIIDMGEHTVRLVTTDVTLSSPPALPPFTPTFEATYSPSFKSNITPYPSLKAVEFNIERERTPPLPGAFPEEAISKAAEGEMHARQSTPVTPIRQPNTAAPATGVHGSASAQPTSPPAFIFGSPHNRISNTQFHSAATAVLAEMNSRLGLAGTSKELGLELLEQRGEPIQGSIFGDTGDQKLRGEIASKFDKAHDKQFQKMEGIGEWFARREGQPGAGTGASKKRKSGVLGEPMRNKSRLQSQPQMAKTRRTSRVVTPGTRKSLIAQAEREEAEAQGRDVKRVKIVETEINRDAESSMEVDDEDEDEEAKGKREKERERERAAIRKRLEISRERRRSSMGKVTVGANKPPLIPNQPKKGFSSTKFGFLSSAKNLVKSVWGLGTGANAGSGGFKPAPKVLTKPNPAKAIAPAVLPKAASKPSSLRVPSNSNGGLSRKPSALNVKVATISSIKTATTSTSRLSSASTSTKRGPIPSFSRLANPAKATVLGSITSSTGVGASRTSAVTGASSIGIRKPSVFPPGSIRSNGASAVTGSVRSVSTTSAFGAGRGSVNGTKYIRQRTSTLLAPTASSLAKLHGTVKPRVASPLPTLLPSATVESTSPKVQDAHATPTFTLSTSLRGSVASPVTRTKIFVNGTPAFVPERKDELLTTESETREVSTEVKQRSLTRRPRISRSRVIARVGAQRAAMGRPTPLNGSGGRRSFIAPKARGSLTAGARASAVGAAKISRHSAAMNARRKMRQSEIMRRRSKYSEVGCNGADAEKDEPTPEKIDCVDEHESVASEEHRGQMDSMLGSMMEE